MTETSFLDMFVELPAEVFETLKGIGERAVLEAQELAEHERRRATEAPVFALPPVFYYPSYLCGTFGWRDVRMVRMADDRRLSLVARLECGHHTTYTIDEEALRSVTSPRAEVELLDRVVATTPRRCYCITRR